MTSIHVRFCCLDICRTFACFAVQWLCCEQLGNGPGYPTNVESSPSSEMTSNCRLRCNIYSASSDGPGDVQYHKSTAQTSTAPPVVADPFTMKSPRNNSQQMTSASRTHLPPQLSQPHPANPNLSSATIDAHCNSFTKI
jgi:hypothetical protein